MISPGKIVCLFLMLLLFSCKKHTTVLFDKSHIDNLSVDKKEKYLDSIVDLLKSKKNDSVIRDLYLKVASEYYYINNSEKSLKVSLKSLELSEQSKDSIRMAKSLYFVGDSYENSRKDSAYFYYLQAQKVYTKINDYDNVGRMLFNKAHVLFYDGNYIECEVEVSKALQYLKRSKNHCLIYTCNNLMGNCLEKLLNYDQALLYHKLALGELEKMKLIDYDKDEINNYNVTSTINICNLYDLKGEFSKSIEKLQSLLSEDLKKKMPRLYANVLSNLAYSKMRNGDYENVESMFFESLKIVEGIGVESDILYKKIRIGEYFLTQKDTVKSIQSLNQANQLAIKTKSSNEVLTSLKLLSAIDKKNSLFYTNQYIKVSDSINAVQKNTHDKYARIEYETSRIEDENKVLTKSNFYILIISFGLILLLVVFFVFRYLKYKNKELQFLQQQQEASEEIYLLLTEQHKKINIAKENEKTKIAKELHDGIMNKIYGVRMNLGFFNSKVDEVIIEKRKEYIFELQNIENEIRTISHDLSRSSFFDDNDFNVLLSGLIENQKDISSTQFKYLKDEKFEWATIQNIYKINVYRIIQEAILNINKYSNAENCDIKIQRKERNLLKVSITDDGDGFDINNKKNGIGLNNMKERANSLNGQLKIESKIGKGTKIEVTFNFQTPT
ncbi:histidine kinase/DNA gyrase B/HSP90-like ATPase [Flavobacterium sp. 9]|uniref:tetratricopeptide repeat-containing sensor histidine kinase n=1 Tax=Flavobacterium sp. 9 TaxID=2035198 RepID=UPI000C5CA246|nr:tetratricopeptide repeat-containing sensor histidine kinase [Flavobacterium sp. 9]PIF30226.1 histidine kinase/DNA gyrase B/HSP90-like ATPase [Flavobacterium sp. 9]